jgi:hypothetical protein
MAKLPRMLMLMLMRVPPENFMAIGWRITSECILVTIFTGDGFDEKPKPRWVLLR